MTDRTTTAAATQEQSAPETLRSTRLYREAYALGQQYAAALIGDYHALVSTDGLPEQEYIDGLETWGGDVRSYLAESNCLPASDPTPDVPATETAPEEPTTPDAPTATLEEANKTLAAFGKEVRSAAEHHFRMGELAYTYVCQYLGCSPGNAKRSSAVQRLVQEAMQWDVEATETSTREGINRDISVYAVCTLLGDGSDVPRGNGTAKGRAKGKRERLSYAVLRQFIPCVQRTSDEYGEQWSALSADVAEKARELIREAAASGISATDVYGKVCGILTTHYQGALDAARAETAPESTVRPLEAMLARWSGKAVKAEGKGKGKSKPAPETTTETTITITPPTTTTESTDAAPAESTTPETAQSEDAPPTTEPVADKPADAPAPQEPQGEVIVLPSPEVPTPKSKPQGTVSRDTGDKPVPAATQAPTLRHLLTAAREATSKDLAEQLATLAFGHDDPLAVIFDLAAALVSATEGSTTEVGPDDVVDALIGGLKSSKLTRFARKVVDAASTDAA